MKNINKFIQITILSFFILLTSIVPTSAEATNISFVTPDNNFIVETNYPVSNFRLEKTNQESSTTFTIYDENNNELEAWVFDLVPQTRVRTSTYRHQHKVALGAMGGYYVNEVALEMSSGGGYAQFNRFMYENHYVEGWSYFKVDNHGYDITPTGPGGKKWPAVGVRVSFTAIVGAQLNASLNFAYKTKLLNAGFRLGSNYYYTKRIANDYTIKSMAW